MGLWNFVKTAGKSVFGDDEAPDAQAVIDEVQSHGISTEGVDISVEGDKVVMAGAAPAGFKEKLIMAAGNLMGVGSVEEKIDGADPVFHEVQKGDTLWAISEKALGNGAHYEKIFEANRPMLSHPDKIYPGQMLIIPQD